MVASLSVLPLVETAFIGAGVVSTLLREKTDEARLVSVELGSRSDEGVPARVGVMGKGILDIGLLFRWSVPLPFMTMRLRCVTGSVTERSAGVIRRVFGRSI
jgi:hypothetical protein